MQEMMIYNRKSEKIKQFLRDYGWSYIFIALPVIIFLSFTLYPLIKAFMMSFQEYQVMGSRWVGIENYSYIFRRKLFWKALYTTLVYTLGTVPVNILISLGLALLIFQLDKKSQTFSKLPFIYLL